MKIIKAHVFARPLSVFLAVMMAFMTSWLTLGLTNVAKAQQSTGRPLWAVMDFQNDTGYGGAEIGREAADALDVELFNTGHYDVVKRSDIYDTIKQLGLSEPYDIVDLQKLGSAAAGLDARAIVTGEILTVSRSEKPSQVEVTVAVRAMDVASGELINGALAQGVAYPHSNAPADDDAAVGEAIRKAAFAAVNKMQQYELPIATVLNYIDPDNVLINKGARDGMRPGLKMLVLRNGEEVGTIQLTNVDQDSSTAGITYFGRGIRPQDRCKALFTMPSYTVRDGQVYTTSVIANGENGGNPQNVTKRNKYNNPGGLLLAILVGAFFLTLVNRGTSTASVGGGYIGNVVSEAVTGGVSAGIDTANLGVHVHWGNGNLNPTTVIGFNIYRDNFHPNKGAGINGTSTTSSTTTTTTTTGATTTGVINNLTGPVLTAGNGQYDAVDNTQARTFSYFFSDLSNIGGAGQTTSGTTTTGTTTTGTTTTGTTTTGTTTGTTTSGTTTSGTTTSGTTTSGQSQAGVPIGTLDTATQTVTGVQLGVPHIYYVTAVYQVTDEVSGIVGAEETPLNSGQAEGYATPLTPVNVTDRTSTFINGSPADNATGVNLTSVVFSFTSATGADSYVVDISPDDSFTKKIVLPPAQSHTINGGETVTTMGTNGPNEDLATAFPGVTTFVFRIGARNSTDVPGPSKNPSYEGDIPHPDLNPVGGSYIYSSDGIFSGVD